MQRHSNRPPQYHRLNTDPSLTDRAWTWDEAITPPDEPYMDPYHLPPPMIPDLSCLSHSPGSSSSITGQSPMYMAPVHVLSLLYPPPPSAMSHEVDPVPWLDQPGQWVMPQDPWTSKPSHAEPTLSSSSTSSLTSSSMFTRTRSDRRVIKHKDRKKCTNCGATKTPSWRRGGNGGKLLCNACGLYEKVNGRRRQVFIQPDGSTKVARGGAPEHETCTECRTHDAKRWRRIHDQTFCDRCASSCHERELLACPAL